MQVTVGCVVGNQGHKSQPKVDRKVTAKQLLGLIESQQHRCRLTGQHLTPDVAVADHIVALANGGEHVIDNISIVHVDVNTAKGTMNEHDFVAMCCQVADWSRRKSL